MEKPQANKHTNIFECPSTNLNALYFNSKNKIAVSLCLKGSNYIVLWCPAPGKI